MTPGGITAHDILIAALGGGIGILFSFTVVRGVMLRDARKRLRKQKDQFVAIASHYLFTPISIIQGALASLQETDGGQTVEERQRLYGTIQKGQQRLWILAEQFVLVNQIEEGMLRLQMETGRPADAIQGAVTAVDVFSREKKVEITFDDQTKALQEAHIDRRRLQQAVIAVLDNAIKFTPEGGQIAVRLMPEAHSFAVEVEDTGPGMTKEAIAMATQAFARGTSSYTYDHEGIGLGLYTASAIMREHGGELLFDSNRRRGTLVTLRFPNT
jgi:two-component system cell cycle sensor histidine kinase PleC